MKQIVKIELRKIDSFKDHPFRVENDEFNIYFDFLDLETQKLYSGWSIYNLLPNEYKKH